LVPGLQARRTQAHDRLQSGGFHLRRGSGPDRDL